jgi:hypothetical protein
MRIERLTELHIRLMPLVIFMLLAAVSAAQAAPEVHLFDYDSYLK